MKNAILLITLAVFSVTTQAQEKKTVVKEETTVKKTSTLPQKVHNTFSKHKQYSGKKIKHVRKTETETTTK